MATPLKDIENILDLLKSQSEIFNDATIPERYCSLGLIQTGLQLNKDYEIISVEENGTTVKYVENINSRECYLTALYAYRTYALQKHDEFASKAVGVKTISFAVTGLIDRARQTMKVVEWCDIEISKTLQQLVSPSGFSSEMTGGY